MNGSWADGVGLLVLRCNGLFLALGLIGPGRISLDALLGRARD
jgi:hypothetical protein